MSNSSIEAALNALLPYKNANQSHSPGLSLGSVSAWDNVTGATGSSGSGGSANDVLQSTLKTASDAVTQTNAQLATLESVQQQMLDSTNQNIQALNSNTASKSGSGSSALSTIGSVASGILGGGSILGPLISGITSLFGGGQSTPTFTGFALPPALQLTTAVNGAAAPGPSSAGAAAATGAAGQSAPATTQQVQIQVSAMDSRSFLDHSDDIASAVRQALLNSHPLADTISEL